MFKKITTSLSKPPLAIFFIKDSWPKVFLYIFLLPIFMVLPVIAQVVIDPSMPVSLYEEVYDSIENNFRFDDVTIDNYTLSYTETHVVSLELFDITIGSYQSPYKLTFSFTANGIHVYYFGQSLDYYSYENLGIASYDFSDSSTTSINTASIMIKDVYEQQTYLIAADIIASYLIDVFDFVVIILLMALLSGIMSPTLKFPYKIRFKLSVYLSTIYIFSNVILILLGLFNLNTISVVLVYIYHFWAYRSIKILPKGAITNGKQ